jgi:branched-chain amino acid aminotransferase
VNVEERPIEISEVFELATAKRLTEAAGIGTAATVAPIGRLRWRDREVDLAPGPGGLLERARVQLDRIRTGEAADRHGWLLKI